MNHENSKRRLALGRKTLPAALCLLALVLMAVAAFRKPPGEDKHRCCGDGDLSVTRYAAVVLGGGTDGQRQTFRELSTGQHAALQLLTLTGIFAAAMMVSVFRE